MQYNRALSSTLDADDLRQYWTVELHEWINGMNLHPHSWFDRVACHEAAHAVVAHVLGSQVLNISFGMGEFLSNDDWPLSEAPVDPYVRLKDDIIIYLAGRVAQEFTGLIKPSEWRPSVWDQGPDEHDLAKADYRSIRECLTKAVEAGAISETQRASMFDESLVQCRDILSIFYNQEAIRSIALEVRSEHGMYPIPPATTLNGRIAETIARYQTAGA